MTVDGEYVGKTEIIEALEPESESCQLPEYPKPTGGATGGLVKNKVIVCGGANWKHQVDPFSECYAFKDNQVIVFCCIVAWIQPDISGCQQDILVVWRWNQLRTF